VRVRLEQPSDRPLIHAVNRAAFDSRAEADLVDALRSTTPNAISLVADAGGELVGHIMFSPVTIPDAPDLRVMGLAPMAVAPERQRTGIGSALIRAGLDACTRAGVEGVFVVGHPAYYPRFGFRRASASGFACEFAVDDDAFMVIELIAGSLIGKSGTVYFDDAFKAL
jgi:putative acetyltransferase